MTTILLLVLGAGVLLFIFSPMLSGYPHRLLAGNGLDSGDDLLTQKQNVYNNILDLDFEYTMGRVTEEDYQRLRDEYKHDAAQILERIDRIEKGFPAYDEWIERAVALYKNNGGGGEPAATVCPGCRHAIGSDDKFCTHCGRRLDTGGR